MARGRIAAYSRVGHSTGSVVATSETSERYLKAAVDVCGMICSGENFGLISRGSPRPRHPRAVPLASVCEGENDALPALPFRRSRALIAGPSVIGAAASPTRSSPITSAGHLAG